MMKKSKNVALASAVAASAAIAPRAALACAMCGLPPGDVSSHAYNSSVLFMMIAPYTIVAGTALGLYVAYRNARKRRNQAREGILK